LRQSCFKLRLVHRRAPLPAALPCLIAKLGVRPGERSKSFSDWKKNTGAPDERAAAFIRACSAGAAPQLSAPPEASMAAQWLALAAPSGFDAAEGIAGDRHAARPHEGLRAQPTQRSAAS
jgi:hypothetical protein